MTDHLAQVRRDGETYLRRKIYFRIAQRFYIGAPFRKWAEDNAFVESSNISDAVDTVLSVSGPEFVTFVNELAGTVDDVSREVALLIAERIRDGECDITDDRRDFIENHFPVGSVIPAAA